MLVFHYSKWATLLDELNVILDGTRAPFGARAEYLLGRGVERGDLVELADQAQANQRALKAQIKQCADKDTGCDTRSLLAGTPQNLLAADYALRSTVAVTPASRMHLMSAFDDREHCASINTSTGTVNWSAPCAPGVAAQLFDYDATKKSLGSVATGKCVAVENPQFKNNSKIVSGDCKNELKEPSYRWEMAQKGTLGVTVKVAGNAWCMTPRDGVVKTAMQLAIRDCGFKGPTKIAWIPAHLTAGQQ